MKQEDHHFSSEDVRLSDLHKVTQPKTWCLGLSHGAWVQGQVSKGLPFLVTSPSHVTVKHLTIQFSPNLCPSHTSQDQLTAVTERQGTVKG